MMKTVFFLFLMLSNILLPAHFFDGNTNPFLPADAVVKVTDSTFKQEVLDSRTLVLVIFWAQWAGPSREDDANCGERCEGLRGKGQSRQTRCR